jgi:hypothetical protein
MAALLWVGVPDLNIPVIQTAAAAEAPQFSFHSAIQHYVACRRAATAAKLLGTIAFYQMKRFRLYREVGSSSYHQWAHDFKTHPDNSELCVADMEWLARAGGIVCFLLQLEGLPDQGCRSDCKCDCSCS